VKVLYNFTLKSIKSEVLYRFDFLGTLSILLLFFVTRLLFLDTLHSFAGDSSDWNRAQVTFLLFTLLWILTLTDTFDHSVLRYFQLLYHGEADTFFIKPVSILNFIFFGWIKASNFVLLPIILGAGLYMYGDILWEQRNLDIFLYFVLCLLGAIMNLLFIANLSCLTFVFKRQVPADFLFSELTKIMILPFSVFPRQVGAALVLIIPSIFTAALPCAVLFTGRIDLVLYFLLGFTFNLVVFILFLRFTVKRYEGLGG
jgi:ABC-type uncharacterized transport system permease subunit